MRRSCCLNLSQSAQSHETFVFGPNQVSSASPPFTASFCVPVPLSLFLRLYIIARLISFGPKCICDALLQRSLVGLLYWQHKRSTGAVYNMYLIKWINHFYNQHLATTLRLQQHLRHKRVLLCSICNIVASMSQILLMCSHLWLISLILNTMTVKTASTTEDVKQCFSQAAEKIDAIFTINTQDQYYKCIRPA